MRIALALVLILRAAAALAGDGIVSLNVCADQYLLTSQALMRVRSLGAFADDPALSWKHAAALGKPRNQGHGENLLRDPPALVIAGRYDPRAKLDLLEGKHIPLAFITPWQGLEHGRAEIRSITAALGVAAEGEALIARIDAAMGRAQGAAARSATVLRLHRRGYVAPANNLMTDIIAATGLTDLAARDGMEGGVLPVEKIIALRPDYLIINADTADSNDQAAAVLVHPALARLYPEAKRIVVPALLAVCEGPSTPDLIDAVAAAVRSTVR